MRVLGIDHVQLAMPSGGESAARRFYGEVLGFEEIPKPAPLAGRGGAWFRSGTVHLHLGVEADFRPARKAHPALRVEGLSALIVRCVNAGHPVERDVPRPGVERVQVADPFGNRIELMELGDGGAVTASEEARNREVVQGYYAAIAQGTAGLEWERWFAPDVVQEEFPNRVLPDGARRDLRGLREAAERGTALMRRQTFQLLTLVASGNTVVVEAEWRGQVSRDAGPFTAGMELRTRFAQVLELRDGRIVALRNYDCFYPA
jgi:ketosteroid isomerase-like protein